MTISLPIQKLEERTHRIAEAARRALTEAGLKLHLESGFSDTVTVFDIPAETTCDAILSRMKRAQYHACRIF